METLVLVARHGQTDWNRERRWQGHADRPLTPAGRAQAQALAGRLGAVRLDAICASDLRRARETARTVAAPHGLEVEIVPALREVDTGDWTGLTRAEAEARDPAGYEQEILGTRRLYDDPEARRRVAEFLSRSAA